VYQIALTFELRESYGKDRTPSQVLTHGDGKMVMMSAHTGIGHSVDGAMARYPKLNWKKWPELPPEQRFPNKNKPALIATAVIGGNKETGELTIMMENAAPRHRHLGGKDEVGEKIITLEGGLLDHLDSGEPVTHTGEAGVAPIFHQGGSVHAPKAEYWLGLVIHPHGTEPAN